MRRFGLSLLLLALVAGLFVSPLWGRAHRVRHYRKAVIEKVSIEEEGALRELSGSDVSPSRPGTRYVVVVSRGTAKY